MKRTVLIAEDDRRNREILAEIVGAMPEGLQPLTANGGQQALELLDKHRADICLVFTDYEMPPGIDGGQVMRRIRESDPRLPIVMISGMSHRGLLRTEAIRPEDHFIAKPIDPFVIQAKVRELLGTS